MAINIVRIGMHVEILAYLYADAVVLAFCSEVVHLATVAVLREYLCPKRLPETRRSSVSTAERSWIMDGLGDFNHLAWGAVRRGDEVVNNGRYGHSSRCDTSYAAYIMMESGSM